MVREGLLVVISGPSGAGKGTALSLLRQVNNNIRHSISATTRKPREGEIDGQNYYFKSTAEFMRMIENDELVEWVEYCDNYYGTPRKRIDEFLKSGYDVVLEIEVVGAQNIKSKFPDCVSIFLIPPSFKELKRRIESRGTESAEVIEKRLAKAQDELKYLDRYDYVVINDILENAVASINSILAAEKLRYKRNKEIVDRMRTEV